MLFKNAVSRSLTNGPIELKSTIVSPFFIDRERPGSERIILCCVLLIGLMIGNAYSGGLASIMTVPQ